MNTHLEELACLYVLDQLDPAARAEFESNLLTDAELRSLVRKLESTIATRVSALPQHEPPTDLLETIEQKLPRVPGVNARPQRSPKIVQGPWLPFARWGIAAVIAVSLATLAVQSVRRPAAPVVVLVQLDSNRSTATQLSLPSTAKDEDTRFIQLASLAESYWKKVDGQSNPSAVRTLGSRGYALFDPASQEGFLAVDQLPAIDAQKHFHLWIVDSSRGEIRDAGILPITGPQAGLYSFSLPEAEMKGSSPQRLNFFVTVEDSNSSSSLSGSTQPKGKVVLGQRTL